MQRFISLFTMLICCLSPGVDARSRQFVLGADISWVDAEIARGQKYYDGNTQKDIFVILADHRFNCIRLRMFVNPTAAVDGSTESPYSKEGYCDLAHTIEFAKKIKKAGMLFLLDFHYSDVWADPGKQFKPVSWKSLSGDDLVKKVRSYTKESLEAFRAAGVLPDMVQVGNEIVGGMIWPDGRSSNMATFAALVNAGIDGVKDVNGDILIVIHSIAENSPSQWLSSLVNAGVKRIDVFALSYYSKWHGTPDDLKKRVTEVAQKHKVKIAVAEYADNHRAVNDIIFNLPDNKGFGTFVWEPTAWEQTLFTSGKTNERIDLYPTMAKDFGNDTLPLKEPSVSTKNEIYGLASGAYECNGIMNREAQSTRYALITLQGKAVAAIINGRPVFPAQNVYIIKESAELQKHNRLINLRRLQ